MWFKNKTTNLEWEITDKELIERLSKDSNYEEVREVEVIIEEKKEELEVVEEVKEEKKEAKKTTTKKK